MRISDWSSDVCSSDLDLADLLTVLAIDFGAGGQRSGDGRLLRPCGRGGGQRRTEKAQRGEQAGWLGHEGLLSNGHAPPVPHRAAPRQMPCSPAGPERKRVV